MKGKKTSPQTKFMGTDEEYRTLAKKYYHDEGVIEIDDNARIAKGCSWGAYVEAWVWVDNPDWHSGFEGTPTPQVSGVEENLKSVDAANS